MKTKISLCLAFLLVAGALSSLTGCAKQAAPKMPPPGVVVAPAVRRDVNESRNYVGRVAAYDEVALVARVEGYLEQRSFAEGAHVKKGAPLFLIEQASYKDNVDAASAALQEAEASLRDADLEYVRHKELYEKNANSKREFEQAETAKLVAEAKVLSAKANLSEAKTKLSYTEILAPFDGKMGMAAYSVGNLVGPSSGALATIVRDDLAKVDFHVAEGIVASRLQDKAIVDDKNDSLAPSLTLPNGRPYGESGFLDSFDNRVRDNTGTVLVRAVFKNEGKLLLPDMFVKVALKDKSSAKAILIPSSALQEDQQGSFVLTVDGDAVVHRRNVEVDKSCAGLETIVKSGLAEGELAIVDGLQKARDGMRVAPVRADAKTAANESERRPARP